MELKLDVRKAFLEKFMKNLILIEMKRLSIQFAQPKPRVSAQPEGFAPSARVLERPQAPMPRVQAMPARAYAQYQAPAAQAQIPTLEKLRQMILDPTVQSIECPGPDKFITVARYGMIQTTNIKLSKEEINDMLKEISLRVRIPLITGVYKVRYQNLLITAVISEFVGTRFVMQKAPLLYEVPTRF